MNHFPVTYWNCINLELMTRKQRIQLYNELKRAVATCGEYDMFASHRQRNLNRVAAWLRDKDGIDL